MRIGVITDIHSNARALRAVLGEFERQRVEGIICCGDLIGIGPEPEETVRLIREWKTLLACVRGNHESYLLYGMEEENAGMNEVEIAHHRWQWERLSEASKAFLTTLPISTQIQCGRACVNVVHYALNTTGRFQTIQRQPNAKTLQVMFEGMPGEYCLYGHDHAALICRVGKQTFINAGAAGCPAPEKNIARAALLKIGKGEGEARMIKIPYDVTETIRTVKMLAYPDYENILRWFYGVETRLQEREK